MRTGMFFVKTRTFLIKTTMFLVKARTFPMKATMFFMKTRACFTKTTTFLIENTSVLRTETREDSTCHPPTPSVPTGCRYRRSASNLAADPFQEQQNEVSAIAPTLSVRRLHHQILGLPRQPRFPAVAVSKAIGRAFSPKT